MERGTTLGPLSPTEGKTRSFTSVGGGRGAGGENLASY